MSATTPLSEDRDAGLGSVVVDRLLDLAEGRPPGDDGVLASAVEADPPRPVRALPPPAFEHRTRPGPPACARRTGVAAGRIEDPRAIIDVIPGGRSAVVRVNCYQRRPDQIAPREPRHVPLRITGQTVGYVGSAAPSRTPARQLAAIGEVEETFTDMVSGGSRADRTALSRLLRYVRRGDTVKVASMDRLARGGDRPGPARGRADRSGDHTPGGLSIT